MPSSWLIALAMAAVIGAAADTLHAEPVVVGVNGSDIYIDLGAKDGVGSGTELELLHEVVVRDPRTNTTLRDRFAIGTLSVVKAGDRLCLAYADGDLAKRVLVGDRVRMTSEPRRFVDPWAERVAASRAAPIVVAPPAPGGVDHAELARQAWQDTLGTSLEQRIDRWNQLLGSDPKSPYRKVIENEIASLRTQIAQRDAALASARSAATSDRDPRIARLVAALDTANDGDGPLAVASLARAIPGRPIRLSFLVRAPAAIRGGWLYVKPPNEPGFRRIELVNDGDAYLVATIDAASVKAPQVEWYVEVVPSGVDAEPEPALGTQQTPMRIAVDPIVEEAPIEHGRSHIDAHVDYVDFDGGLAKGHDQYYQAEIDFTYRFLDPVYAVRLGFGTLSGIGGPKDIIDEPVAGPCTDAGGNYRCRRVTFSYVYTELEYRFRPNIALMLRPQAGLLTEDVMPGSERGRCQGSDLEGCEFFTGFGLRARLRLGSESATNLVLAAGFTDGVGTLLEAAYHWLAVPIVPVQLTVQVTDQPVVEDFGVRLIADVGIRALSWFYPSMRVSYQARDINHAGFSGGLALNFDW
ncbi:MAG: hypothetical protein AB7O24_12865 [Kofleriaceae bacterium]